MTANERRVTLPSPATHTHTQPTHICNQSLRPPITTLWSFPALLLSSIHLRPSSPLSLSFPPRCSKPDCLPLTWTSSTHRSTFSTFPVLCPRVLVFGPKMTTYYDRRNDPDRDMHNSQSSESSSSQNSHESREEVSSPDNHAQPLILWDFFPFYFNFFLSFFFFLFVLSSDGCIV